jgi:hypothetical protein
MLKARRLKIQVLMSWNLFSIYLNLPVATWPWGLLSHQQKRVPEDVSGGKVQPVLKVDNPTAIREPTV